MKQSVVSNCVGASLVAQALDPAPIGCPCSSAIGARPDHNFRWAVHKSTLAYRRECPVHDPPSPARFCRSLFASCFCFSRRSRQPLFSLLLVPSNPYIHILLLPACACADPDLGFLSPHTKQSLDFLNHPSSRPDLPNVLADMGCTSSKAIAMDMVTVPNSSAPVSGGTPPAINASSSAPMSPPPASGAPRTPSTPSTPSKKKSKKTLRDRCPSPEPVGDAPPWVTCRKPLVDVVRSPTGEVTVFEKAAPAYDFNSGDIVLAANVPLPMSPLPGQGYAHIPQSPSPYTHMPASPAYTEV